MLSEDELSDYQEFFDNNQRLRELLREPEELALAIVEADQRSTP